jgi:hypothetical protein
MLGMRGTVPPSAGLMKRHAEEIKDLLVQAGVADMPLGVDLIEPGMWLELERVGLKIVDGQQVMLDAREIKNIDEIVLLNQAAAMVDAAYHLIWEELKPGVRENDIVARVNKLLSSWVPTTSRRSTRFRASVAILTRTTSPIVCFAPAIRPSSISCIPSSVIGPATTGPSMSAARRRLSTTPTRHAGNGSTRPST